MGTLSKVTGYTGFNETDPSQQSGYYLPFLYEGDKDIKMYVNSSEKQVNVDKAPNVNVVYLGATKTAAKKAILHLVDQDNDIPVDCSKLTFA